MDQFPLGGMVTDDQKWYYTKGQRCEWLGPFVEAMENRASAECAILRAAGLSTTTWHECNGSLGPDVIQHIYKFLVPSEMETKFLDAAWSASEERDRPTNDMIFDADAPRKRLRRGIPATAKNGRPITEIQKQRKVRSRMAAIELRLIRLNADSRWAHECMRRLNFCHLVQACSIVTDAKHRHLECVSWFLHPILFNDESQKGYGDLSSLPIPDLIAVGEWSWGEEWINCVPPLGSGSTACHL